MTTDKSLILASTSPRRQALLRQLGLAFQAVPSDYVEDMSLPLPPHELAKTLSKGKAEAVAASYPGHIIIAADTFVALGDELLGKPHTPERAIQMLRHISGQTVSVITGFTIVDTATGQEYCDAIEAKIFLREMTDEEITAYVNTGEPLDKAGAFAIQGKGAVFVEKIEGDYHAVMGLPLFAVARALEGFGVHVFGNK